MSAILFGAAGAICLYDWLNSKGQQLTESNNITSDMTIQALFQSNTACVSQQSGFQSIQVTAGTPYEPANKIAGGACSHCSQALEDIKTARTALERDAVVQSNAAYTPQTASAAMQVAMTGGGTIDPTGVAQLGACDLMCHDVVIFNVQQSLVFNAQTNCQVTDSIQNELTQTINGLIQQSLSNQQDFIGQLEDAFTSNQESITTNLASHLSQSVTQVVNQSLINAGVASQTFVAGIAGTGDNTHSIYVNTVQQHFTGNSTATLSVTNQLNNNLRNSTDYSISQSLLNKNDSIGDITTDFLRIIDSMGDFMVTSTGLFVIILGAVIALGVMTISALYIFNRDFRNKFDEVIRNAPKSASEYVSKKIT